MTLNSIYVSIYPYFHAANQTSIYHLAHVFTLSCIRIVLDVRKVGSHYKAFHAVMIQDFLQVHGIEVKQGDRPILHLLISIPQGVFDNIKPLASYCTAIRSDNFATDRE